MDVASRSMVVFVHFLQKNHKELLELDDTALSSYHTLAV